MQMLRKSPLIRLMIGKLQPKMLRKILRKCCVMCRTLRLLRRVQTLTDSTFRHHD